MAATSVNEHINRGTRFGVCSLASDLAFFGYSCKPQTACLLTCCTYILSQRKDIEQRLRAEILAKVGPSQRPTYDQIREMKYMRAFINGPLFLRHVHLLDF